MGLIVKRDDTAKLFERLTEFKALALYVGYQGAEGAEIHPGSEITVAKVAAIHEWGAESVGIPQRSYIRATMIEKRDEIGAEHKKVAAAVIEGKVTPVEAYSRLGALVAELVRRRLESSELDADTLSRNLTWAVRKRRRVLAKGK